MPLLHRPVHLPFLPPDTRIWQYFWPPLWNQGRLSLEGYLHASVYCWRERGKKASAMVGCPSKKERERRSCHGKETGQVMWQSLMLLLKVEGFVTVVAAHVVVASVTVVCCCSLSCCCCCCFCWLSPLSFFLPQVQTNSLSLSLRRSLLSLLPFSSLPLSLSPGGVAFAYTTIEPNTQRLTGRVRRKVCAASSTLHTQQNGSQNNNDRNNSRYVPTAAAAAKVRRTQLH